MEGLMDRVHREVAEWMRGTQGMEVEKVHFLSTENYHGAVSHPVAVMHYNVEGSSQVEQYAFYDSVEELLATVDRWRELGSVPNHSNVMESDHWGEVFSESA